jgi:hypothetical protein
MKNMDLAAIAELSHSTLRNYILPGLDSSLLGTTTRIFTNTRESSGMITPHSHRFDFQCLVMRGSVVNAIYEADESGDAWMMSSLRYLGEPGAYEKLQDGHGPFSVRKATYEAGEWYGMQHDEIHSISFSRDAVVLFIEGAQVTDTSVYLEPFVRGEVIPTMTTESWMFAKEAGQ